MKNNTATIVFIDIIFFFFSKNVVDKFDLILNDQNNQLLAACVCHVEIQAIIFYSLSTSFNVTDVVEF